MNTTTAVVATGAIVVAGKWANDEPLSVKLAVGVGAFALALTLIGEANDKLASQFALLVLILAMFRYVPAIAKKTGLVK